MWFQLLFRELLRLLVYGNILIGLGAYGLSSLLCSHLLPSSEFGHSIPLFLFAATTFTYNIHRRIGYALGSKETLAPTTEWMLERPLLSKSISIFSFAMALVYMVELPKSALLVIVPISLISLFYVQRLSEGKKVLREIPYLKIFLIAIVWTAALVILPLVASNLNPFNFLALSLGIFLYMLAEIIPFDIRDMKRDEEEGTRTFPLLLGIQKSKVLALILLATGTFMFYLHDGPFQAELLAFFLSSLFLAFFIGKSKEDRSDLFYSFGVEFSLILPYLLSLFISFLWS